MIADIERKVIEIIAKQAVLDVQNVNSETSLVGLGLDSLALVESIFAIEDAFDISVPFNANSPHDTEFDMSSVAAIVAAVEGLILQKAI